MTVIVYVVERHHNIASKKKKKSSTSSTSTSFRSSSLKINNIVDRLKNQQYRDSTRHNYYTVWKLFSKFMLRLDHRPTDWSDRVTLFMGYLLQKKYQSTTVKSYISAIKAVLLEVNAKISEDQYTLSALI